MTHDGRGMEAGVAATAAASATEPMLEAVCTLGGFNRVSPHGGVTPDPAGVTAVPEDDRYENTALFHSSAEFSAADCSDDAGPVDAAQSVEMTPTRAATVVATDAPADSCKPARSDAESSELVKRPAADAGRRDTETKHSSVAAVAKWRWGAGKPPTAVAPTTDAADASWSMRIAPADGNPDPAFTGSVACTATAPEPSPQPSAAMTALLEATPARFATSERSDWPVRMPLGDAAEPAMSAGTHAAPGMASVTSTAGALGASDASGDGDGDTDAEALCDSGVLEAERLVVVEGVGVDDSDVLAVVNAHTLCPTDPLYVPNAHGGHGVDSAVAALNVSMLQGVHDVVPLALNSANDPEGHG